MLIALDHLSKIVVRAGEGYAFFLQECSTLVCSIEALFVERQFTIEVVIDVGYYTGSGGGKSLMSGEG